MDVKETVKAYAKINLHLDVVKKREDGYHDIQSVMQSISLCDEVTVTLRDSGFSCTCDFGQVPQDESNIAIKAAKLYFDTLGSPGGVHIDIKKRIPMAAGLAGGSADAAATLLALNRLIDSGLYEYDLARMSAALGADIPFCVMGNCAIAEGKGEILSEEPGLSTSTILVVACGGEGVSTPMAYKLLDEKYNDFKDYVPRDIEPMKNALRFSKAEVANNLFNIFEEPIFAQRPIAAKLKRIMIDAGASGALMSGSGPSVFGIFDSMEDAELAVRVIIGNGCFATVCHPVFKEIPIPWFDRVY